MVGKYKIQKIIINIQSDDDENIVFLSVKNFIKFVIKIIVLFFVSWSIYNIVGEFFEIFNYYLFQMDISNGYFKWIFLFVHYSFRFE